MVALQLSGVPKSWRIIVGLLALCCNCCSCSSTSNTYGYVNQTVEAVLGSEAALHCDTSVPRNDQISIIVWFRENDSKVPGTYIYSLDKRNGSLKQFTNPDWSSSAMFQLTDKNELSVLTLRSVKRHHEGLYRCRVDFKKSPSRVYIVNVTVIVPPDRLQITDHNNNELRNNHIGPYRENETVMIICAALGGSPPPRVNWFKGPALLTSKRSERLEDGVVRNSINLTLTRDHLNSEYTCQASTNGLTSLAETVTINMTLSPLSVKLADADQVMSAERSYDIRCYVYGAHPSPVIKWSKGNEKLKNYEKSDSNDGNVTISRLSFNPQPEDDGKLLSCAVDSVFHSATPFSDSRRLNIIYKPTATVELGKNVNASAVNEGSDVYFECHNKSKLPVTKILWKLDGRVLLQNLSAGIILTPNSLVLQKVSRRQSGMYSCVASNAEGDSESAGVPLNVKFAPVCQNLSTVGYGVDRTEKVRIECAVDANPSADTFVWEFNSTKTGRTSKPNELTNETTRSYIEFQPNSENDYGTLYCKARNSMGEQKLACAFNIYPVGKPDALTNCTTVSRSNSNSLMVKCEAGFDGGSEQRFEVEVRYQKSQRLERKLNSLVPEFLVTGLKNNVFYDFTLYATNEKGSSPPSFLINQTLDNDMDNSIYQAASGLSPIMLGLPPFLLILSALVVALILLSCCIVIVIRSKEARRRKKNYVYKSKESLEKNPDIIPNDDDVSCTFEITTLGEEKQRPSKQTDISLILENSYGTDMNSDFVLHRDCQYRRPKMYSAKKTSSLRKLNDSEITYASCDQPCPPFVTQETPLLSGARVPFIMEGQNAVPCCIHGLSRSTSIS